MWQQGSVLRCCCLALCLAASAAGRGLLITDQQAQSALDTVSAAAGDIWGQASQALDSSSLADGTMNPWQRNHTIEAINRRAPQLITDWGYVIRPQVASALHNAENGWGPVNASFLRNGGAPAPAPAQAAAALSAETAPRLEGGRKLMQTYGDASASAPAAVPYAGSAVFAPLAAPGASVAGAAAPDLAQMQYAASAPGPSMQFQSLQPLDSQPYTSFAATRKHKKIAGEDTVDSSVPAAQLEGSTAQQGVMNAATAVPTQQSVPSTASAVPAGASSAAQQQRIAAGGQVPTQAGQAASAAYPAQQGVVNAGSNVPSQGSQAATSVQGAVNMGTNVPVQQDVATTGSASGGGASGSTAKATLPKQANLNKAPLQPVQAQMAQSPSASATYTPPATTGAVTLQNGGLQPKTNQGGVSLDPNQPNRLPGMIKQATYIQQQQDGYSPPVTPTSATEGTAFAGTPVQNLPGPLQVTATSPLDGPSVAGSVISLVTGVRIATPFFGTGFNFCVDRYFGSFPKVGIVIPNIGQWLLPELQDLAKTLQTTLQLPPDATIGHGFTLEPSSDGLLITFPTVQPNNIPDVGIRYGIQIGQAFGYDFGIGIIRDICFITFVTV